MKKWNLPEVLLVIGMGGRAVLTLWWSGSGSRRGIPEASKPPARKSRKRFCSFNQTTSMLKYLASYK
ncbi:MAG: hypothetical protein ACLT8E_07895 [Akkermansia sp.]